MRGFIAASMTALFVAASAAPVSAQKAGGTLRVTHRDNPPSASIHEEATISTVMPFMSVYNNLVVFDPKSKQNAPDQHRARPRDRMGVERRRHQAHLQAARRREVARRQALHQRRREVHLGHADLARIEAAQEPAQAVVVQPQGGDGERRPRGHLPSRPAAALGAHHAGRRHVAGLSLPRAGRADAHQADRHRPLQVRRAEAERIDEGRAQPRLLEARPALPRCDRVHHHCQPRHLGAGLRRRQVRPHLHRRDRRARC